MAKFCGECEHYKPSKVRNDGMPGSGVCMAPLPMWVERNVYRYNLGIVAMKERAEGMDVDRPCTCFKMKVKACPASNV